MADFREELHLNKYDTYEHLYKINWVKFDLSISNTQPVENRYNPTAKFGDCCKEIDEMCKDELTALAEMTYLHHHKHSKITIEY